METVPLIELSSLAEDIRVRTREHYKIMILIYMNF